MRKLLKYAMVLLVIASAARVCLAQVEVPTAVLLNLDKENSSAGDVAVVTNKGSGNSLSIKNSGGGVGSISPAGIVTAPQFCIGASCITSWPGGGSGVTSINASSGAFTFSGAGVSCTTTTCTFSGTGSGVATINSASGAFTFTGSGVSCTSTTCTFTGGGVASINSTTGAFTFTGSGVSCTSTTCTFSTAAANLTGTALPSAVVTSSLTSVGTIGTGVWQGTPITNAYLATPPVTVANINITVSAFSASPNTCYRLDGTATVPGWTQSTGTPSPSTTTMTGLATTMAPHYSPATGVELSTVVGWGAIGGMNLIVKASATNTLASEVCNVTASTIAQGGFVATIGAP